MALKYDKKDISALVGNVTYDGDSVDKIIYDYEIIWSTTWETIGEDDILEFYDMSLSDKARICAVSLKKNINNPDDIIDIVIPEKCKINGVEYTVVAIMPDGFSGCDVQTIFIPKTIVTIGWKAFYRCKKLQTVNIAENSSLSVINDEAFRNCDSLQQINLSDAYRLTSISSFAFASCNALQYVILPDSVTEIGNSAFRWCTDLITIKLSRNTSTIGSHAFSHCWDLKDVYLPSTITSVGWNAFNFCLTNIYCGFSKEHGNFGTGWQLDFLNTFYWDVSEDDMYSYTPLNNGTYEIYGKISSLLMGDITIPREYTGSNGETREVSSIGINAFEGNQLLTSVIIPDTVTQIKDDAFRACRDLTSVEIPDSVTSIGKYAFYNCDSLASVVIPDGTTTLSDGAFYACENLTSIVIPDSLTSMGYDVFRDCPNLTIYCQFEKKPDQWPMEWDILESGLYHNVVWLLDKGTEEDEENEGTEGDEGDEGGEEAASSIFKIKKYIDGTAGIKGFKTNDIPSHVVIPSSITVKKLFGDKTYKVTNILKKAFEGCTDIESVVIPDGVTTIGKKAFRDCSNLTSITIPDSVSTINEMAFEGCYSLVDLSFGENSELTTIKKDVFKNCDSLLTITIPNKVARIDWGAFRSCRSLGRVIIPDGVTVISDYAFEGCVNLISVNIPDSVTNIDSSAFQYCSSLTSIVIPDSVTSIDGLAFYGCTNLSSVKIGSGLSTLMTNMFYDCDSLTSVTIPANITIIRQGAFRNCDNLTTVEFEPNSQLKEICDYAFRDCVNLTNITIPNSDSVKMGKSVFDGCTNLQSFGDGTTSLFDTTTGTLTVALGTITSLPSFVTTIGEYAFSKLTNLVKFTIPENINAIATNAFLNCLGLREVYIPSTVKYVQANAFKGCRNLTIKCAARKQPDTWDDEWNPDNLPVEWGCYEKRASDELFTYELLSDNTYSIEAKDKSSLPSRLVIPGSYQGIPVTKIAANGFAGCNVVWVDVLSGIKTIELGAFKNCKTLLDINFPETLEYIQTDAFYGCENLALIQLPNSIKSIASWAFRDCDKAKDIYIPSGVEMINNGAFIGIDVEERKIWCENTEAEVKAKNWDSAWNAKDISGINKFPVTYDAAAVTDSSKFNFYPTAEGTYYVKPKDKNMVVVNVPASYNGTPVTEIGSFRGCNSLVKIILPDSITRLRVNAFADCRNLNEITLPNSLRRIEDGAFKNSAISSLIISDAVENSSLTEIFMGCRNLRHISLPEGWTTIGSDMFNGCVNLTDIVLPNSCNYIKSGAFADCENLQNVYLYNKQWIVGNARLDLTDKTSAEVAQLLTNLEYNNTDWQVSNPSAPILEGELDEYFVEFTVKNPNNIPQVVTVSLTLKDSSAGRPKKVYAYSEKYPIGANQSISDAFDMPLTEDYSDLIAFTYAEIVAKFETGDQTSITFTYEGTTEYNYLATESDNILTDENANLLII